ncbi:MAG: FAD-dependent oxidoreductase, partial [Acidobacteriota bacterium]
MSEAYDLIVIGSGPGGYVAAIRAAQLGLRAAVVEKDPLFGGTCLHRGCIPTKALLHTASSLDAMRAADKIGIRAAEPELDLDGAHGYKDGVVTKNAKGVAFLFKKNGINGLHGFGRLLSPTQVEVTREGEEPKVYETRFVVIATGSVPREIPVAPSDGERILNSDHALELRRVPSSLVVLGAGAVGTEFASIYRSFGSEVTVVEMLPRMLPIEDADVSKELEKVFRK